METDFHSYFKLFSRISKKIHANNDTRDILACIVENITQALSAKGCIFWILNTRDQAIETKISYGFDYRSLLLTDYHTLLNIFEDPADRCVAILDARNDPRIPDLERLGKRKISAITGLFFDIAGPYTGLLAIYFTGSRALTSHELELVTALGEQGAIALEKAIGYDKKMLAMYREIVEGFALAIEARDKVTHGHSMRVARLSRLLARKMELDEAARKTVYHAAILHDIGKIGTRDHILDRLGKLSRKELTDIRRHPVLGADILAPLTFFCDVEPLVRHHHELFDGSGYPDGKKGEEIPVGARILAVCDAFETMITGRPNLPKKAPFDALSDLQAGAGTRFDPDVVGALFGLIREERDDPEVSDLLGPGLAKPEDLDRFFQNMTRTAEQNRLEKKFSFGFTAGF